MNVKQFYIDTNSNYEEALSRMMNDFLIEKLVSKFIANNQYSAIISAYDEKNYQEVFANAHALKGVAGNLALTSLYEIASILCEATRNNATPNLDKEIETLKERYSLIINCYNNG